MKICDSHTDFLTVMSKKEREEYVKTLKGKTISCAVFTTHSTISVKDVENLKNEIKFYNKKYKTNLLLSIEDLGFVKTEEDLNKIIDLKPISVTLTWNDENQFSGGANSRIGLTERGVQVIKRLEENNIIIDTAHMSRRSFYDFVKFTTKPIYNSHSNVYSLYKHNRNLTDKQIMLIVESGGFLGLTFYQNFIADRKIDLKDVALQFDYLIKKFGYKNFGLGTDLYGIEKEFLPIDFKKYKNIKKLKIELKKLKYSKKIINGIIYKNYKNFLKNNSKL